MTEPQTLGKAWRVWRDRFSAIGIATPALDAKLLAQAVLGCDAAGLALRENDVLPQDQAGRLAELAGRRLAGEPVARILGEKEFYGLGFGLNGATLVPRPETELLVDLGLRHLAKRTAPVLLDLGTGSGAIAIGLLAHMPEARGVATDVSDEALLQARANAERHGVAVRLLFLRGSWFDPLPEGRKFDLIVSNPPYIETSELARLDIEVRDNDPLLALDGGADGLDAYRVLAARAKQWLLPEGALIVEIGSGQAETVEGLLGAAGFGDSVLHRDLGGLPRVLVAIR